MKHESPRCQGSVYDRLGNQRAEKGGYIGQKFPVKMRTFPFLDVISDLHAKNIKKHAENNINEQDNGQNKIFRQGKPYNELAGNIRDPGYGHKPHENKGTHDDECDHTRHPCRLYKGGKKVPAGKPPASNGDN